MKTAKSRLEAEWRNQLPSAETVLEIDEAIMTLRKDDPRPLLIVRECDGCKNKEGDLLERTLEDERFLLASRWFHCVKLDKEAHLPDHPYNKLFRGSVPAHVVLASWDGKRVVSISRAGQKEMWKSMQQVLRVSYKKSPTGAMKQLTKLLEKYDAIDEREEELLTQLAAKEERGKARRAEQIREEIGELEQDRRELLEKEAKVGDLGLKPVKERDGEKG